MVEVTLHRDDNGGGNGDGPLPLFFAPVIGTKTATLSTKAVSAMLPANGFRIPAGSSRHAMFLPFALDEYTWQDLLDKDTTNPSVIPDSYAYDPDTKSVCSGNDEIYEVDLYPYGHDDLPPGNRGTVDLGASNNSTSDLARQILYGLNADDLSHFPNNEVKASCSHPLPLNGDTGISAGMKDELQSIIGQPRCIPIFTQAVGNGNNCTYTIIKFVGVRVVDVKLTGNPKYVRVQPCPFSDENVTYDTSGAPINNETIFSKPVLIQ